MDIQAIEKYICEKKRVDMPNLQEQFALSYSDMVKALSTLEKKGIITYCDGLSYEWNAQRSDSQIPSKTCKPKDNMEATFIRALWECIKNESASTLFIQDKCMMRHAVAKRAFRWMVEKGFISSKNEPVRDILISQEEFMEKYGKPDDIDCSREEGKNKIIEHINRKLMYLKEAGYGFDDDDDDDDEYNDDDDDDEDEYNDDDDDDDDEDDDVNQDNSEERKKIEQRREELLARMRQINEEEEQDRTAENLFDIIEQMPNYNADDHTFSFKMNVMYPNKMPFRMKVIKRNGCWYMSDCGNTINYLSITNDKEKLTNRFERGLNSKNIRIIDHAVCTLIDDVDDLMGEGVFLFKVVNALLVKERRDED